MENFWAIEAAASKAALATFDANDAGGLAAASASALWGAEMRLGREGGPGRPLADRAIRSDLDQSLLFLAKHPAWVGARCEGVAGWRSLMGELIQGCVQGAAAKSLVAIGSQDQSLAWSAAAACAPSKSWSGWVEGYRAAGQAALAFGAPASSQARGEAAAAVLRGLSAGWSSRTVVAGPAAAVGMAKSLLDLGALPREALWPLVRAACAPGPNQREAWNVAVAAGEWHGVDVSRANATEMGLPIGRQPFKRASQEPKRGGSTAVFGETIDVAWLAAAGAINFESVAIVKSIAAMGPSDGLGRPLLAPSLLEAGHPLAPVWDVWSHSVKAGFALPAKPVDVARKNFAAAMDSWDGRGDEKTLGEWRRQGFAILDELAQKRVPPRFGGFAARPEMKLEESALAAPLSPMAWRAASWGIDDESFVAVALAQAELGYDFAASMIQMKMLGMAASPAAIARTERALMLAALPERATRQPKPAGPRL